MVRADCIKCRWFVEPINMTTELWEEAATKAPFYGRNPDEVRGWCRKHKAPIFYYKGYCRDFEEKRKPSGENKKLDLWLEAGA